MVLQGWRQKIRKGCFQQAVVTWGEKKGEWKDVVTYSALDGSEGKHVLGSVAAVSTPGLVARVVSLLQDKLLSLELWVLITHPARQRNDVGGKREK